MKSESEDEAEMDDFQLIKRKYDKYIKENFNSLGQKIN